MICEDRASRKFFIRVRVVINAARPFLIEVTANLNYVPFQVMVQHENLPHLCFTCGLLGHDKVHCPKKMQASSSTSKYSPNIRAKGGWRQVHEVSIRPVPNQLSEGQRKDFDNRINNFGVPVEEAIFFTNFINDPIVYHEPFFQPNLSNPTKHELQITSVEAVAFFQNNDVSVPLSERHGPLIIRESNQMEADNLMDSKSELKNPDDVLQDLSDHALLIPVLIQEQVFIKEDLAMQHYPIFFQRSIEVSRQVPDKCKISQLLAP
ncbi:hypothetical protein LINGRAHAP2_LOCUS1890 [Linum grandiflorum]